MFEYPYQLATKWAGEGATGTPLDLQLCVWEGQRDRGGQCSANPAPTSANPAPRGTGEGSVQQILHPCVVVT
eukprot:357816-Chlamydomonas_euryale.AAC.6